MVDVVYLNIEEKRPIRVEPVKEYMDTSCRNFLSWLHTAAPGEEYCYHTGLHIMGILVGRTAFRAYESGQVILYQRREGVAKFSYWAKKRKRWHYN